MDLGAFIGTATGVLVSVVLALIGYRRSVGVRDERVRRANSEVSEILAKRVVSDDYAPTTSEIFSLVQLRSFENQVAAESLFSPAHFWHLLVGRIVEHEYITAQERQDILKRLAATREAEREQRNHHLMFRAHRLGLETASLRVERSRRMIQSAALLAVFTTIAGTLVALGVSGSLNGEFVEEGPIVLLGALAATLAASAATLGLLQARRSYMRTASDSPRSTSERFEEVVKHQLDSIGAVAVENEQVDFIVRFSGVEFPLELRRWKKYGDDQARQALSAVAGVVEEISALRGFVVVDMESETPRDELMSEYRQVEVVRVDGLAEAIENRAQEALFSEEPQSD